MGGIRNGVISDVMQAMRYGARDYAVKPIHELEELGLVVKRALAESSLRREADSLN